MQYGKLATAKAVVVLREPLAIVTPPLSSINGRCVERRIPDEADRDEEERDDGRTRPRASTQEKESQKGH